MPVISGKAFWAKIYIPTRYQDQGDATWSIDICNLDAKNLAIAKKYGMNIKDKGDEKGEHVTIKRKAEKWGNPNTPPALIDMQKSPIHTNGSDALLGNGSEVNVSFTMLVFLFLNKSRLFFMMLWTPNNMTIFDFCATRKNLFQFLKSIAITNGLLCR